MCLIRVCFLNMDTDEQSGRKLIEKWRQLRIRCQSYADRLQVLRLAYALHIFLVSIWRGVLLGLQRVPRPAMLCYMSDGWSAFTWTTNRVRCGNGFVESWHLERIEYLLQRAVLRVAKPGGGSTAAIMVSNPRPLLHGKGALAIYKCFDEFHKPLREFTVAACILFCVFDGLHLTSMARLIMGRRVLFYEYLQRTGQLFDHIQDLTDFTFFIHCVAHVFSLALKWGLSPWCTKDLLKDIHVAIKACARSSYALSDQFDLFLSTRVVSYGTSTPSPATLSYRMQLWRLVIRDPRLLELFEESGFFYDASDQLVYVFDFSWLVMIGKNVCSSSSSVHSIFQISAKRDGLASDSRFLHGLHLCCAAWTT